MASTRDIRYVAWTITDYKREKQYIDFFLLVKLNTFARFEDNTEPPTVADPKDCELSFFVADVSKTILLHCWS